MVKDFLYDGAEDFFAGEYKKSHFVEKKLSYAVYKNAIVLPFKVLKNGIWGGGIISSDGTFLKETGVHYDSTCAYEFDKEGMQSVGKAIYISMFNGIWGHCLTDDLRRLWFLFTPEYEEKYKDYQLIYIQANKTDVPENFKNLLKILGIEWKNLVQIKMPQLFEEIIIPDESFYKREGENRYYTREYVETIKRITDYADKIKLEKDFKTSDKIYFTYSRFSKSVFGEEILEKFFKDQGYAIIAPEEYSLEQQLVILRNCKNLAGSIGSSLHNAIFMRPNSKLLLIPRAFFIPGYQLAICEAAGLDATYIDSSLSNCTDNMYPYMSAYCFTVSEKLCAAFGIKTQMKQPIKSIICYSKYKSYCKNFVEPLKMKAPEYYDKAVKNELKHLFRNSLMLKSISTFTYIIYYLFYFFRRVKRKIQ